MFTDSQSQDSEISESRLTPQPKTKWTPQSDYVEKEVDKQIRCSIDFAARIETDSDTPPLPAPPSVTLAQGLPPVPTPPLSSMSPTKQRSTLVEQPLHIDVTQPQTSNKSDNELQTTSQIIVDIILSPSQDSNVETHDETHDESVSPTIETNSN